MSTPISEDPKSEASKDAPGAKLIDLAETQSESAPTAADTEPETGSAPKTGASKLSLLLLVLLAISIAANVYQARERSGLASQAEEFGLALDGAVERLDEEMIRADRAEETLGAVDRSVETVNARIVELQEALSELSEITKR